MESNGTPAMDHGHVDANVDAWNSVNTHRFDVWCSCESSRTFDPAVGLGTSISGVELPPPKLRKVAHIRSSAIYVCIVYWIEVN